MATKKIKIGVVGLGRIGWGFHCRRIHENKHYELVAVSDVSEERCKEATTTYGCKSYTDYKSFLNHEGMEAVVISTPTHLHKSMTIQALKAQKHVLLEKPMASDYKEAQAMISMAKKKDRIFTIYQPARTSSCFQHLKKVLSTGIIGKVYHIHINRHDFRRRNDWQSLQKYSGGMLYNYGGHALDLLLNLTGYDVKDVFCALRRVATLGDADDVIKVLIRTKAGVLGEVDINCASLAKPDYITIYGTTGVLSIPPNCTEMKISYLKKNELPAKKLDATLTMKERTYPRDNFPTYEKTIAIDASYEINFYADFAKALRHGKKCVIQPQEVAGVMKLIDQCKKNNGKILDTRI